MRIFIELVIFFLRIYIGVMFVRIIISWFRITPQGLWAKVYKILVDITEPFLIIFRKIIPLVRIGRSYLDLSYIAAILVIEVILILLRYLTYRYV